MDARLGWMALGTFAVGTGAFVIASLLPGISSDFAISVPQAGLLVLLFAVAYAIGTPVLSTLTGGLDRRQVLTWAMVAYAAANIAASLSPSFETLLAARIAMAVASGVFAATAQGTAVLLSTPSTRARAIAVIVGGTTLSVALGAPLGSLIANLVSWRLAFFALGIVSLAVALALRLMLPGGLPGTPLPLRERLLVVTRPGMTRAFLVTIFALASAFIVFTYVAVLAEANGLGREMLPAVLVAFGIGAIVGNYASGRLADTFGPARTVGWVLAVMSVIMVGFTLEAELLPKGIAGWVMVATMVPWGFVGWGFPPAQSSHIVSLAPELAPISLSLNASAIYAGIAVGSGIGGYFLTFGSVRELGVVAAVVALVALAIHAVPVSALRARRPEPRLG